MGSNVLSRRYTSKAEFMAGSLAPMARAIDGPLKLEVRAVIGGEVEEWAVVVRETHDVRQVDPLKLELIFSPSSSGNAGNDSECEDEDREAIQEPVLVVDTVARRDDCGG